jgi:hypothetical protein
MFDTCPGATTVFFVPIEHRFKRKGPTMNVAQLFTNPDLLDALAEEASELEASMQAMRVRHEELRKLLSAASRVSRVVDGVALHVDSFDETTTQDVHVTAVAQPWPSRRAYTAQHVTTGRWMVVAHGPGAPSGGKVLDTHHDQVNDAVEAAVRWVVRGDR